MSMLHALAEKLAEVSGRAAKFSGQLSGILAKVNGSAREVSGSVAEVLANISGSLRVSNKTDKSKKLAD
jgi:hypothetical protein